MTPRSFLSALLLAGVCTPRLFAAAPQTADHANPAAWRAFNRAATHTADHVHLDARQGDGVLWLNGVDFADGTVTFEVRGRNAPGQSFVGLAFHGTDDRTYEGVYFRPFNFHNPERKAHAVQYISLPEHDWSQLRQAHPGVFEASIPAAPDPDAWFRVRIEIAGPRVTAFVNDAPEPVLTVQRLAQQTTGRLGLWVGNGSQGWFRHLSYTPAR